ncbi:MAG: tryptophan--tRNA ligase [Deltaproteobacteria bacterium]|nr:tryptophan--tRNA ligase [Deltaproteobacteria bacterium]
MTRQRILTGMRPTGPLHLGHYAGALENWLSLQNQYECYFLIADYQALGDHIDEIDRIRQSVWDVALDWLAVGLDPDVASFVIQSYVPEHAELTMYLSMLTPLNDLQRNPTLKAEMAQLEAARETLTLGFFNYPVSQIADILLPKAHLVPVGEDQVPHIEFTREIVRKFNRTYGNVFPEPRAKVGRVARLVGIDGRAKMSKSLNNAIHLSDGADVVRRKVKGMITDITGKHPRLKPTDPGIVENNPVFLYHDAFNTDSAELEDLKSRYRAGRVSDGEVKDRLVAVLNDFLDPIRERRARFEGRRKDVRDALLSGSQREKKLAEGTMRQVRDAMRVIYT